MSLCTCESILLSATIIFVLVFAPIYLMGSCYSVIFCVSLLSPTLIVSHVLKLRENGKYKYCTIRILNRLWLTLSVIIYILISLHVNFIECLSPFLIIVLLSRCFEIFYAFIQDSYDKLLTHGKSSSSCFPALCFIRSIVCCDTSRSDNSIDNKTGNAITFPERLVLAFRSYIELIFNFATMYLLLPSDFWKCGKVLSVTDALYYSGVTITTIGYGDITPTFWFPQFLSVFEAMCGIIIIVVCFTIYVSRALVVREKHPLTQHYIDANCLISELSHNTSDETYTATLIIDGKEVTAMVDLDETEREQLIIAWNNSRTIDLQINVAIKKETVIAARIVSIGVARNTAVSISSLVK